MNKKMSNQEIAELFKLMAAAHEVKGESFFIVRAYQNASSTFEHATSDLRDLWQEGKLQSLSGIGGNIAKYLDELFTTGKIKHFEDEIKGLPAGMFEILSVSGIGAKTAAKLARAFNLDKGNGEALKKLKEMAVAGKIAELPGFGKEKEKKILNAIDERLKRKGSRERLLLPEAEGLATEVVTYLKQSDLVLEVEVLGSLRRRVATVGDVDLAVRTEEPLKVMEYLKKFPGMVKLLSAGEKTTMFVHRSGRQIDVKTSSTKQWGAMLQHYTGSKFHNIKLRTHALEMGLSLSEYGIKKDGKILDFSDEKSFYKKLGMDYIPPELREDTGEIEAAKKGALPSLIELSDIKGDLHMHCDIYIATSHDMGRSSLKELLDKANELSYEYIGISDHNPKSSLSEKEMIDVVKRRNEAIEKQKYEYEKTVKNKVRVLKGLEVDIKSNGSLAVSDKVLKELDYAIISVHSSFDQDSKEATKRILSAMDHPKVRIFGHPSGRKLNHREGIDCNWQIIFEEAKKRGILMEINSSPERLDLSDSLVKEAVDMGVRLIINTDSHGVEHMDLMKYGIFVARRGWVSRENIANTRSWNDFEKIIRKV